MAEAEPANDRGVVKSFPVSGVERNSLRPDQLFKDEESDLSELVVEDKNGVLGIVKILETVGWYKYGQKQPGQVGWNGKEQQQTEVCEGWVGLFDCIQEKFNEVYPEDQAYKHWGNPHNWEARGIIQEHLYLYHTGEYAHAQWQSGPFLKLFNAGNLLFTSVFPHVTGMSMCMINYYKDNQAEIWGPNRGFYTSMQTMKDYYPLNFKANEEKDGWKPTFKYPHTGFALQLPYTAEKPVYDEGGDVIGKKPELCGDWILPFHMWNAGLDAEQRPVADEGINANNMAEYPATKVKVTEQFMKTQKYDFAGNLKYKLTKVEISKESFEGHHDIYIMGESNKEIICGAKFREGIMLVNFATKEYPKNEGRHPQMNKANAYRVKQFFGGLIEKGFVTTFGGDATADMFKA